MNLKVFVEEHYSLVELLLRFQNQQAFTCQFLGSHRLQHW